MPSFAGRIERVLVIPAWAYCVRAMDPVLT